MLTARFRFSPAALDTSRLGVNAGVCEILLPPCIVALRLKDGRGSKLAG